MIETVKYIVKLTGTLTAGTPSSVLTQSPAYHCMEGHLKSVAKSQR